MLDPMDSIRAELTSLSDAGLRRNPPRIDSAQGPDLVVDGQLKANFCSNDYLGLAAHPALTAALAEAASRSGFGSAASRLISGSVSAHLELEAELARWLDAEQAVLFNSGYQANIGVVSALAGPDDAVFSDALNHASLIDGCRLSRAVVRVFPHLDFHGLDRLLTETPARRKLVVSESLFSMDGDTAKLDSLREVASKHGAILLIDEAHAVGVEGEAGRGLVGVGSTDVVIGTLGKAFGSFGAYAAGRLPIIELARQKARSFVFSTALPAAISEASRASLRIVASAEGEQRRAQLRDHRARLRSHLLTLGVTPSGTHIQPIPVRDGDPRIAVELAALLYNEGIFVQAIRPPTVPRGTARLRVTLRSDHRPEQIDHLAGCLLQHRALLRQ